MPTRTAVPAPATEPPVIRAERYRLRFDSPLQAALCAWIAGTCRYLWHHLLADCQGRYCMGRMYRIGPQPFVSFFTLRHAPDHAWLKALPYAAVRYALKDLADAYARSFTLDSRRSGPVSLPVPAPHPARLHPARQRVPGRRPFVCTEGRLGAVAEGRHGIPSGMPMCSTPCRPRRGPWAWIATWARPRTATDASTPSRIPPSWRPTSGASSTRPDKARERSPSSQPPDGGYGPHGGRGGPGPQGQDPECQGHGGGAGPEHQAASRPQPRDPEVPLGAPGTPAGLQGGCAVAGRSRLHVTDVCGVPTRRQGESQDPGLVPVYGWWATRRMPIPMLPSTLWPGV